MRSNCLTSSLEMDRLLRIPAYRSPGFFTPPTRSPAPNAESCPASAEAMELLPLRFGGMNDTAEVYWKGRRNATTVANAKNPKVTRKIVLFPRRRAWHYVLSGVGGQ